MKTKFVFLLSLIMVALSISTSAQYKKRHYSKDHKKYYYHRTVHHRYVPAHQYLRVHHPYVPVHRRYAALPPAPRLLSFPLPPRPVVLIPARPPRPRLRHL